MINGTRLRHFTGLFVMLLCTTGLLLACVPNKTATPSEVDEVEVKTTDPLKAFEEEYAAIGKKVEGGSLPSEIMSKASEVRMRLQKYLIKTEAELDILRLDVLQGGDAQRETALDQIVALVEEREQTKIFYLQELQALKTGRKTPEGMTSKKWTGKEPDIKIKIAPEEIGNGERP